MKLKISGLKNISLTPIRAVVRIFALVFVFVVYFVQLCALAFRRKKLASDLLALFFQASSLCDGRAGCYFWAG